MTINDQIKSRKRVVEHGEVFTSEREVEAMLDLVIQETERIESRFLEPACGNGNFLVAVFRRKLRIVDNRYKRSICEWEFYSLIAVASIYGVDILIDNVKECRERLFRIWESAYKKISKNQKDEKVLASAKHILSKNILCGDALTMKERRGGPIIFSEWTALNDKIKRSEYRLDELLECNEQKQALFTMTNGFSYNEQNQSFIPNTIKDYSYVYYKNLGQEDNINGTV